jgi:serine/threonine protein kinase
MNLGTRPAAVPADLADASAIKAWLDALANGTCDAAAFLLFAQERIKTDPDGNWEVLSQLDQYYRRGRINAELFQFLNNILAESALGARNIPVAHDAAAREPAHEIQATREVAEEPDIAAAREAPAAPEISAAREIPAPNSRGIPVATDVVFPQTTIRSELSGDHTHREAKSSEDAAGELKGGSVLRRRYRIESIVGQGSTGTVYQALDEYRLDVPPGGQRLAIKVLHTAVTKRAEALSELRREFQALQLLSHPNILRVFEFDRDGPVVFFTMELLHGAPLSRVLDKRKLIPLERAQALAAICDIGTAFAYAHSRGMVHGNINPQGIFVTTAGAFRVIDFGAPHASARSAAAPDQQTTLPSAAAGYASCQVLEGQRADARDDVFSLACLAYLLLCGRHPFSTKTSIEARDARLSPRRPSKLTNRQWRTLRTGMSFERAKRPADIQQWLEQFDLRGASKHLVPLADLLDPPPAGLSSSILRVAAVAAALLLIVAAGYWAMRQPATLETPHVPAAAQDSFAAPPAATQSPARPSSVPAAAPRVAASSVAASSVATSPVAVPPIAAPPVAAVPVAAPPAAAAPASVAPASVAPAAVTPLATAAAAPTPSSVPLAQPSAAPNVAAPGSTKIELVSDTIDVPDADGSAQIPVHRKGSLRGETSFTWWTESGTAKPGIDFSPVVPQLAYIGDGKSGVNLNIPLTGAKRAQSKSFYVVVDHSEGGALLGGRTLTMVTLPGAE